MLKNHMPSSPMRPPVAVLHFTGLVRLISNWGALYAARRQLLDAIDGHSYKQVDPNTIVTDDEVTIKSEQMNDLLEYEPTKEEAAWQLPDRDAAQLRRLRDAPRPPADAPQLTKSPVAHSDDALRAHRASPAGFVSLATICADLQLDPREARAILRKTMPKGEHGWNFSADQVDEVKKRLSAA